MGLADWFRDQPPAAPPRPSGPVQVGWFLADARTGVIYEPPERLRSPDANKTHAKSAARCPAVVNMESRYFVIRCPFDLHLRFARSKEGKPAVRNMLGEASPVRPSKLAQLIHVTPEPEWRYADRPTIQVSLPYMFIADEPVYLTQLAAFLHYRRDPLPGTIFGGRFPIHLWPRPLMWAFEWHDPSRDIVLRRGEPWFYVTFETEPQDRPVQMVEATRTPELQAYMDHVSGAVNYVNQTFSLFKAAGRVRPAKLLVPLRR
ncbi:MAG: hypothetical protein KatS3mg118_0707 [Paracoccaceae bacterium]|nr:MAG: hypothetical protein D6686_11485 [Alphaproteobacteria bacterium]GIX12748.1 MAG: hypothetical protein KatS3mg118_0707 [Paracoccaceae bacterium]